MFRRNLVKQLVPLIRKNTSQIQRIAKYQLVQQKCFNSLNFMSTYNFFNLFQSKSKPIHEKYKDDITSILSKADEEEDLEQKENLMFEAFQLFSDAKQQEVDTQQEICPLLFDIFDQVEKMIDDFSGWNEDSLYQMRFLLLQAYFEYNREEKLDRYIKEFTSDYFIDNVMEKFEYDLQIIFTIYFSQLLNNKEKRQEAIKICEKFLNDLVVEDQITVPALQQIYVILIQLYKSQNMHTKAFQLVDRVTHLVSQEKYIMDLDYVHVDKQMNPLNEILFLIGYCYEYQQYEFAYNLGESMLSLIDQDQEAFDNLSYEVNLLKNLDKHYKILLSINLQIQNQENNAEKEVEDKFIKSLDKFLNYQDQYNQNKTTKSKSLQLPQIIEKNLHKFSSDSKHQILKIAHKFDCLSN